MDRLNEKWSILKNDTSDRWDELMHRIKLNELYEKKAEEDEVKRVLLIVLAAIGIVAFIAGISYAVYKFMSKDYLEDYEDDFDDDFLFDDDEKEEKSTD